MVRKIIEIDEDLCNGCGLCVTACHEGAIVMVDGKARLLRDDYCDGLGACLPSCPTGAINFIEREAAEFDEEAVRRNLEEKAKSEQQGHGHGHPPGGGCPGSMARALNTGGCPGSAARTMQQKQTAPAPAHREGLDAPSRLGQWPVQIKLVPVNAPYFDNAKLLIAADCTSFAFANFHERFMRGKVTIIGCPKLDEGDYAEKLTEILKRNSIKSVTVVRMEVPCCGGLENAAIRALQASGKMIPWEIVTLSVDGHIIED